MGLLKGKKQIHWILFPVFEMNLYVVCKDINTHTG